MTVKRLMSLTNYATGEKRQVLPLRRRRHQQPHEARISAA
jgi:hypothetical protein